MLAVRQRDDLENERELVEKAQQSREAFGLLYEKYYDGIYRFALHRTANVQTALDITSTVFIKALDGIGKFRWRDIPFSAWLYRIATNEINGYFRSKKHHTVSIDENPHVLEIEDPVNEIMEAEDEMQRHEDFLQRENAVIPSEATQSTEEATRERTVLARTSVWHVFLSACCDVLPRVVRKFAAYVFRRRNRGVGVVATPVPGHRDYGVQRAGEAGIDDQ